MFRKPAFIPIAGGIGLVLFVTVAITAPLDTWWPLLAGPAEYEQTLIDARFVPLQPYVDNGCPWPSVVAWQRLRKSPNGSARMLTAFAQARTPAARMLAAAGLFERDSTAWAAVLDELHQRPLNLVSVDVLFEDQDMPRPVASESLLGTLQSGALTRHLESVDVRPELCWSP